MLSIRSRLLARLALVVPHAIVAVAGLLAATGCSAGLDAEADGPPDFRGNSSGTGGNSQAASATPGNPTTSPIGTGTGVAPTANGTEQNPANGTPLSPNTNVNAGSANAGAGGVGNVSASGGAPGTSTGTAGSPSVPPSGAGGAPVTPAAPDIPCPAGASFCSGFEGTGLPAGSQFEPAYLAPNALGTEVTLDTTVFHSGRQSLHMPVGSNYYRMLAVPVPSNSFWIRLYTRSNVGFGAAGSTHASLFMGSIVAPGGDYNADRAVEVAEQFGQVLLNVKDALFGTSGTNPNGMPGTRLPNDTWTCMEAQFDGATGDVRVFVEGNSIIDATGWQPPTEYKSFRFGYLRFDSPARDVWMDDVVVASSRIGCE
jgi:polysaccharide lyase-like protein